MQEICWSTEDAKRLKMLRLAAGYDLVHLSKLSSVSIAQISQLEESGDSLFYSERIKYSVGKRLTLLLLKSQRATLSSESLIDEKIRSHAVTSHSQINAIAEMSRRNLDASPVKDFFASFSYRLHQFLRSKYVVSSLGMLVLMLAVWFYEKQAKDAWVPISSIDQPMLGAEGFAFLSSKWNSLWLPQPQALSINANQANAQLPQLASKKPVDTVASPQNELAERDLNAPANLNTARQGVDNSLLAGAVANVPATASASSEEGCAFSSDGPELSPTVAHRPGNYVYLVGLVDTVICLKDGLNKVSRVSLMAGASQTVWGDSPWRVTFKSPQDAKIFYQGQKMQLSEANNQTIKLVEFRP